MNVLLINPTYHSLYSLGLSFGEPLGLAYIAAVLERDTTHKVEILDSVGLDGSFEKEGNTLRIGLPVATLLGFIKEKNPDVIGVSLITSLYSDEIIKFLGDIKKLKPDTPLVIGGAHATLEWKKCICEPAVDFIVCGEGEATMVELLKAIEEKGNLHDVQGIVFRDRNGKPVRTADRPPIDIESLPFPARHLLPMENYLRRRPKYYYMRHPVGAIITSRACPFNCIFCSTTLLWGRQYRGASPAKVVDEMESLTATYGVNEFLINDDSFTANRKRVIGICDEIIRRKLNIRFQIPPGINLHLLDEELLWKLKRSGLYILNPQFETGNPETVKYIRKPIHLEQGKKMIEKANRIGFWTKTNIILGFPEESAEDIETTIRFCENLEVDAINFILPIAYDHTDLGKEYIRHGLMPPDQAAQPAVDSLHFTKEKLEEIRQGAIRRFNKARLKRLLNPRYFYFNFIPKISSPESLYLFARRIWFEIFQRYYRNI